MLILLIVIVATIELIHLLLVFYINKGISKGIYEIVRTSNSLSRADFTDRAKVISKDEIGLLANSFNQMIENLQKETAKEKKAVEALREQKDLYETLILSQSDMGEGITIMDFDKIIYLNNAVPQILGYSKEEIYKISSVLSFIAEEERNAFEGHLKQLKDGIGKQTVFVTRIKRKNDEILELEYTMRSIRLNGHINVMSIIRDITEKNRIGRQLQKEKERAETAEIAKKIGEQFLANMSHEIRTPMNAIVGFTDLALKTPLTAEQRQYIDAVKSSGDNLLVIINDILDLSRMRSGKIPIEQIGFSLSKIVSTCENIMLPAALKKGLKLKSRIDSDVPNELIGDPVRLNQVLINLVANAIKFTSKGEVSVHVKKLSEDYENVQLEFAVRDTGIGIPEDKCATVFETFTQANTETSRKYGGTGLGLAIVKQLAEIQNGSISVTSIVGKGSCFYFRIPYKKSSVLVEEKNESPSTFITHELPKNLKVLLVEDNKMNQVLAQKILTDWGWDVTLAENGLESIEKLEKEDFDIILMDIQMPEMDGYTATTYIRKEFPHPKCDTPIMAMTAHIMHTEEEKCYKVGMNGYISKPFKAEILYQNIASVLRSALV